MLDLVIVGAGAAGIGAARAAREVGLSFELVEASHRVGGRAYTETLGPGWAFDLGCHWLHSASINPLRAQADRLGMRYRENVRRRVLQLGTRWASPEEIADYEQFWEDAHAAMNAAVREGRDVAVAEVVPRDSRWTDLHDYWTSLLTSADADQVSIADLVCYRDTEENWPLEAGYGTLVARLAEGLPVRLNSAVERIRWDGGGVRVETVRGDLEARAVLVTVSTGVLAAGDIRFVPSLPDWKQAAVTALALGVHNRIALVLEGNPFGDEHPYSVTWAHVGETPMNFILRPFGHDYVVASTGGRFAAWLERAGVEASVDLARTRLRDLFGADVARRVVGHKVTAWATDPWVRGAYSAAAPGGFGQREVLGRPLDDRLFFAGEAVSPDAFATCHGAFQSGQDAVAQIAAVVRAA
ncbi:MAG: FAD-dependent oxidoreductase [Chromatiales bacterium]|nr:FAD-dependent oxidoreductase [Chromatiales bacterium]